MNSGIPLKSVFFKIFSLFSILIFSCTSAKFIILCSTAYCKPLLYILKEESPNRSSVQFGDSFLISYPISYFVRMVFTGDQSL